MWPYDTEVVVIYSVAGEPPRQFRVDPRCLTITSDDLLHLSHRDEGRTNDGRLHGCRCRRQ